MFKKIRRKEAKRLHGLMGRHLYAAGVVALIESLPGGIAVAEDSVGASHSGEREGIATIIHRADVIRDETTNRAGPIRLWPLYSTSEARMNYVEVTGHSAQHYHPDAGHTLYVLEGRVAVTAGTNTSIASAGDLIIIPKGVRHSYDLPAKGERALLLTFDAPPYDPRKTVNVEPPAANK